MFDDIRGYNRLELPYQFPYNKSHFIPGIPSFDGAVPFISVPVKFHMYVYIYIPLIKFKGLYPNWKLKFHGTHQFEPRKPFWASLHVFGAPKSGISPGLNPLDARFFFVIQKFAQLSYCTPIGLEMVYTV